MARIRMTDRYEGWHRSDDRGRKNYDSGYDTQTGSGRRAFGSWYLLDDDYESAGDHYEDSYDTAIISHGAPEKMTGEVKKPRTQTVEDRK